MAIQKQKRKITYSGQNSEEEDEEERIVPSIRIQKKDGSTSTSGEALNESDGESRRNAEEEQNSSGEIRASGQNVNRLGTVLDHKENGYNPGRDKNEADIETAADGYGSIEDTVGVSKDIFGADGFRDTTIYRKKQRNADEMHKNKTGSADMVAESYRHFSAHESDADERISYMDDINGERVVRVDEVRLFQKQEAAYKRKEKSGISNQDQNQEQDWNNNQGKEKNHDLVQGRESDYREIGKESYGGLRKRQGRSQESVTKRQGNEEEKIKENAQQETQLEDRKKKQEEIKAGQERYGKSEQEYLSDSNNTEQNAGRSVELKEDDAVAVAINSGRVFHRERETFYHTANQPEKSEEAAGTSYSVRQNFRMFSKNSMKLGKQPSASEETRASNSTHSLGWETRKSAMKTQETENQAKSVAGDTRKAAGKTVSETMDSITMYSEVVTRPLETGKRTFSAGRETFSEEFHSVKEFASSAKDADEVISSKAKEMLKAMAIRTFREAAMLPVKAVKAIVKTVATVLTTISTGGMNLVIMVIALILSVAVLVSVIMFAGIMLIAYGTSEGILPF